MPPPQWKKDLCVLNLDKLSGMGQSCYNIPADNLNFRTCGSSLMESVHVQHSSVTSQWRIKRRNLECSNYLFGIFLWLDIGIIFLFGGNVYILWEFHFFFFFKLKKVCTLWFTCIFYTCTVAYNWNLRIL